MEFKCPHGTIQEMTYFGMVPDYTEIDNVGVVQHTTDGKAFAQDYCGSASRINKTVNGNINCTELFFNEPEF